MQGLIASSADGAYLRAAKFAASGTIPVVGSAVSSLLGTLGGGLAIMKSAVGGVSVYLLLSYSLAPLIILLLYKLCLALATMILEFSGSGGGVRVFSAFSSSLDAVIAVYVTSCAVYLSEILIFVRCGVSYFG